jgi:hypothetical protein
MIVQVGLISGLMFGIEFFFQEDHTELDIALGIVAFTIMW